MKNHAKVGNKPGQPAYRTPSSFKIRQNLKIKSVQAMNKSQRQRTGGQKRFGR